MNSKFYKCCVVPQCKNTTIRTPGKVFIHVPRIEKVRKKWLQLARRDPALLASHSKMYFCEDHFNLPTDMENYTKYHIMGWISQIRIKAGHLPTKFECQPDRKRQADLKTTCSLPAKRQRLETILQHEKELVQTQATLSLPRAKVQPVPRSDYALAIMVKQGCPDETQESSTGVCKVKEEPADEPVDSKWEIMVEVNPLQESEDEARAPLIDIVKCESTLIQTLDDDPTPNQCSAPDSTAPSAEAPAAAVSATGHRNEPSELINGRKRMKLEYSCNVCNKMFTNKKVLSQHKKFHSKCKPKKHKCDVCEKAFTWKSHLNIHMNIHSKLVTWECDVCNKEFNQKYYYNVHRNIHSKLKKWKCDVCHKIFYQKRYLSRHINLHSTFVK